MNPLKSIALITYVLMTLLAVAFARDYYSTDKKAQERPFMMSSRFGRAGGGANGSGKHVVVAPRADKFFLASRFGKRSSSTLDYPPGDALPLCGSDEDLSCAYTGLSNIYRCVQKTASRSDELSSIN